VGVQGQRHQSADMKGDCCRPTALNRSPESHFLISATAVPSVRRRPVYSVELQDIALSMLSADWRRLRPRKTCASTSETLIARYAHTDRLVTYRDRVLMSATTEPLTCLGSGPGELLSVECGAAIIALLPPSCPPVRRLGWRRQSDLACADQSQSM